MNPSLIALVVGLVLWHGAATGQRLTLISGRRYYRLGLVLIWASLLSLLLTFILEAS